MKCYVVTQGPIHTALIEDLLASLEEVSHRLRVLPTRDEPLYLWDQSPGLAVARSRLAVDPWPVALVFDAYSTHGPTVREKHLILDEALHQAGSRDRYRVILAIPGLTACLFRDEDGLRRLFGDAVTPERLLRARFEPDVVTEELLATRQKTWNVETATWLVKSLDRDLLRQDPAVQELLQFLNQVLAIPAA